MKKKSPYAPRTVARFTDAISAHIAKGRLEAEGIRVIIANEHHVWANWLYSNALGGVEVQVWPEDEERARKVVEQINSGYYADGDKGDEETLHCPCCGSTDISEARTSRKIAFLSLFVLSLPLPFARNRLVCRTCGHRFEEDDKDGCQGSGQQV